MPCCLHVGPPCFIPLFLSITHFGVFYLCSKKTSRPLKLKENRRTPIFECSLCISILCCESELVSGGSSLCQIALFEARLNRNQLEDQLFPSANLSS
jgi:hypothetical protein